MTTSDVHDDRGAALAAWVAMAGAVLVSIANIIHPRTANIATAEGLLATIAPSRFWLLYHLGIVFTLVMMVVGTIGIGRHLVAGLGRSLRVMAEGALIAGTSVLLVNFAFDGIAFKSIADFWASAEPGQQADIVLFVARPVVVVGFSLFSMAMITFFGVPFVLYAAAVVADRGHPWWIAVVGFLAGVGGIVTGTMQVLRGPSRLTIDYMFPPVAAVGTVFVFLLGASVLRQVRASRRPALTDVPEPAA